MWTYLSRRTHLTTAARLRRITAALATLAGGLLAWAAATAAVFLDRARAGRRSASAIG